MEKLQDFGPFRIVRQIAVGGMAEIYLARQRSVSGIERTVVLKRILERYAQDAEFITMFLDEARLLAALSHPNIAQVFDVGKVGETPYLVMEQVRGPTLGKLLVSAREKGEQGLLPRREALGIALAVAEALHYVHERRDDLGRPLSIVHRDLNPSNVIVSYDGAVKLIDFGIAKAATKVYETRTGVIKGTYGYIAPEALVGTKPVDRRADVFALGILLYEMCVGVHPYDVSDEPNLINRILEARYRRPMAVRADIPADLDKVIAGCLAPQPEGRPSDVAAVIDALATHLAEKRMVPTQHAIGKLVHELVPDEEGPRPLKPLTSPERPRPLDAATRELRVAVGKARPGGPSDDVWSVATQRLSDSGEDLSLPLSGESPLVHDEVMSTLTRRDPPASLRTGPADHKRIGEEDEEIATTLMPMPAMPLPPVPASKLPSLTPHASAKPGEATWVPPRKRQTTPVFSKLWLVPIAFFGLVGAALFAFVITLAIFGGDEPAGVEGPPSPRAEAAPVHELRIVSEPAGARVSVDGESAPGRTPLVVTLPADTREVWLRLSKEGYLDQERRVRAGIGEARFVLRTPQ